MQTRRSSVAVLSLFIVMLWVQAMAAVCAIQCSAHSGMHASAASHRVTAMPGCAMDQENSDKVSIAAVGHRLCNVEEDAIVPTGKDRDAAITMPVEVMAGMHPFLQLAAVAPVWQGADAVPVPRSLDPSSLSILNIRV